MKTKTSSIFQFVWEWKEWHNWRFRGRLRSDFLKKTSLSVSKIVQIFPKSRNFAFCKNSIVETSKTKLLSMFKNPLSRSSKLVNFETQIHFGNNYLPKMQCSTTFKRSWNIKTPSKTIKPFFKFQEIYCWLYYFKSLR